VIAVHSARKNRERNRVERGAISRVVSLSGLPSETMEPHCQEHEADLSDLKTKADDRCRNSKRSTAEMSEMLQPVVTGESLTTKTQRQ